MKSTAIQSIAMPNARTIDDVRLRLLANFNGLCNGTLEPKDVAEINNTAGKIISSCKVQLEYHAMRGEEPDIAFLNCEPTTKLIEQDKKPKDKE